MAKSRAASNGAIYIGADWIPGVPARDLSPDEWLLHQDAILANEEATGIQLYEQVAVTTPTEAPIMKKEA